jgi:hypothetical protein
MTKSWSRWAAFTVGFGSSIDIYGLRSYRAFSNIQRSAYPRRESDWRQDVALATIPIVEALIDQSPNGS